MLVLADEPTGNLDSHTGLEIMALLRELHERGRTIVMVTHETNLAAFAERVIRFQDGRIETDQLNGHLTREQKRRQAGTAPPPSTGEENR